MNAVYFILPVVIAIYSYVYTRSIRSENKNLKNRISVLENELGEIEKSIIRWFVQKIPSYYEIPL